MHLDQVCVEQEIANRGPESDEQAFEVGLANVSQTNPDHLGRRSLQHDAIEEIGITGKDGPIPFPGMTPKETIAGLLPEVSGVGTLNRQ